MEDARNLKTFPLLLRAPTNPPRRATEYLEGAKLHLGSDKGSNRRHDPTAPSRRGKTSGRQQPLERVDGTDGNIIAPGRTTARTTTRRKPQKLLRPPAERRDPTQANVSRHSTGAGPEEPPGRQGAPRNTFSRQRNGEKGTRTHGAQAAATMSGEPAPQSRHPSTERTGSPDTSPAAGMAARDGCSTPRGARRGPASPGVGCAEPCSFLSRREPLLFYRAVRQEDVVRLLNVLANFKVSLL